MEFGRLRSLNLHPWLRPRPPPSLPTLRALWPADSLPHVRSSLRTVHHRRRISHKSEHADRLPISRGLRRVSSLDDWWSKYSGHDGAREAGSSVEHTGVWRNDGSGNRTCGRSFFERESGVEMGALVGDYSCTPRQRTSYLSCTAHTPIDHL